jgi:hypothetical protein
MRVEVAYSPAPRQVQVVTLDLPAGCTVADALRASGLLEWRDSTACASACGAACSRSTMCCAMATGSSSTGRYRTPKRRAACAYKGQRRT